MLHVINDLLYLFLLSTEALFSFFTLDPNDRGYGHLAVCGSIRCRGTTK